MSRDDFSFDGIEDIDQRIHALADQLAYMGVWDRTDRRVEEPIGRFDFDPDSALPYLGGGEPEEEQLPPEPEDADEQDTDLAQASGGPNPGQGPGSVHVGASELAKAACRWLRGIAIRNTLGWPKRRFRVRLCGPKGMATLDGGTFLCRNHGYEEESDDSALREMRIPAPTFEQAATTAVARPMQALGDYYAQWGQIVLGAVGQMQGVNNAMLSRLQAQLTQSRDQVDQLVASILNYRVREAEAADERDSEERKGDARTALARDALHQLGEAARTFLVARGINPEMTDVVATMGASPDLVAALNDPEVKGLMQNPENLKILANMLRGAAAQARAAKAAQAANGNSAPDASSSAA